MYKYINEYFIEKAKNPIKTDGISYSNPREETLLSLGYLPLIKSDSPEEKEGFILIPKYTKESDKIIMTWEYIVAEEDH